MHDLFEGQTAKINLKDDDSEWHYSPEDGMIRRRAVAGKDTIGDIRITYYRAKKYKQGISVSVLGKVSPSGELTPMPALSRCISAYIYGKKDFVNFFLSHVVN